MRIEYLIDKKDYKKLLPKGDYVATNNIVVKKTNSQLEGKDNYLLRLYTTIGLQKPEKEAIALSEYHKQIKQSLLDNKVTFRILLNLLNLKTLKNFHLKHLHPC